MYSPDVLYPLDVDEAAGSYTSVSTHFPCSEIEAARLFGNNGHQDPLYWNHKPSLGMVDGASCCVPYAYPVNFTDDLSKNGMAIQHSVHQPQAFEGGVQTFQLQQRAVPHAAWAWPSSSSSSKCNFRGTCKLKHGRNYWEAHIWWKEGKESGRQLFLGQYKTEELAARARDCGYLFLCRWKGLDRISKKKHFLNFPQETYEQVLQRLTAEADARQDVTEELPAISKFLREKLSKIFSVP